MFELLLGDDWPARVLASRHPLAECLHNWAAPALATFVRIGDVVDATRGIAGWLQVAGRLNSDPEQAIGAIAELTIAARAKLAGVAVSFSPPNGRGGHADLLISHGAVDLHVEICVTKSVPTIAERIDSLENQIFPLSARLSSNIAYGGRFLREPNEEEVESLAAEVAAFTGNVETTSGLRSLTIADLLELRCIRFDDPAYQECVDGGLVGSFEGIVFSYSPFEKLARSIRNKARQLPATGSGLLVITPPSFLGQAPPTDQLVEALRETLREIPRVVALALHWYQGAWPAVDESIVTASGAFLVQEVVHPPLVHRVLLIPTATAYSNRAFDVARRVMGKRESVDTGP